MTGVTTRRPIGIPLPGSQGPNGGAAPSPESLSGDVDTQPTQPAGVTAPSNGSIAYDESGLGLPVLKPTEYGSTVLFDPRDVTVALPGSVNLPPSPAEQQALSTMSAQDQATYQKLKVACGNDAQAQASLSKLLVTGTLSKSQSLAPPPQSPSSLLNVLGGGLTQPLGPGIDRNQLISSLIQETATPQRINQGKKNTCGVTAPMMQVAASDPAEYARVTLGLASPQGQVTLSSGINLTLPGDQEGQDAGRSASQRLLAPALMDLADGTQATYNDSTDKNTSTPASGSASSWSGETQGGTALVLSAVLGQQFVPVVADPVKAGQVDPAIQNNIAQTIQNSLAQGIFVPVSLRIGQSASETDKNHEVLVVGSKDGRVQFWSPWGRVESMSASEFTRRINGATFSNSLVSSSVLGQKASSYATTYSG